MSEARITSGQAEFQEYARAWLAIPTILEHGTEAQKKSKYAKPAATEG